MESIVVQEKQGLINKRRHKANRELKRLNVGLEAKFKKKRERIFEKLEIELESMPEISEREEIEYLNEADYDQSEAADDARDGLVEFNFLKQHDVARVGPGTVFSDGSSISEEGYNHPAPDPDVLQDEESEAAVELAREAEATNHDKAKGQFYSDRGSMGRRGKGHRYTG